ncbi:PREDICTED: ATM interactor-like [Branchiostoma belcheri]|uniref:ATM interactor-like n=1 Tax=Branchiostoma belcheri TaxID=7741 RepID=A0A6P4YJZ9_BRABE|nr:PREDICTED: ATM interactor-like [Branchiostoma belcheri]
MEVEEICPPISHLEQPPRGQVQCHVEGCGQTVANQSALSMHMAKRHGLPRSMDTDLAPFTKGKKKKTIKHFYCPVADCERRLGSRRPFTSMFLIKQHYARMHAEKKFHCTKCGFGFAFKKELERHEKTCGQIWHCSCGCPYTTMEALWTHAARKGHSLPDKLLKKDDSKVQNAKRKSQSIPQSQPVKVIVILPNQVQGTHPPTAASVQAQSLVHPPDCVSQSGSMTRSQPDVIGQHNTSSHNQSASYHQVQPVCHTTFSSVNRNHVSCAKIPSFKHSSVSSNTQEKEKVVPATKIRRYVQILPKPKVPSISYHAVSGTNKLSQNSSTSVRCETAVQATTTSVCEVGIQTAAPSYIKRRQRIARQKENKEVDTRDEGTQTAGRKRTSEKLITQNVQTDCIPLSTQIASRRLENLVTQNVQTDSIPLDTHSASRRLEKLVTQTIQTDSHPLQMMPPGQAQTDLFAQRSSTAVQAQLSPPMLRGVSNAWMQVGTPLNYTTNVQTQTSRPQNCHTQTPYLHNPPSAGLQTTREGLGFQGQAGFPREQQFPLPQQPGITQGWLTVPTLTNPISHIPNMGEGNILLPSFIPSVPRSSDGFLSGGTQTDTMFQEAGSLSSAQTQTLPLPSDIEAMIFEHTSTQTLESSSIGIDGSGADMSSVEFSSMETQTTDLDFDIEDFLLLNDSQTQTNLSFAYQDMEPLHSYTQTDPEFNLHDLLMSQPHTDLPPQQSSAHTQTMQNTADNFLSNMETQTAANGFLFPELELTDMETQAGSSFVGGGSGNAQTQTTMDNEQVDTHTQTLLSEFGFLQ